MLTSSTDTKFNEDNDDNVIITKQSLFEMHAEQLKNGESKRKKSLEIVDILGGIDTILSEYLDGNKYHHSQITQNQLIKLQQIFIDTKKGTYDDTQHKIVVLPNKDKYKEYFADFILQFDSNNNYLHSLFAQNIAIKIWNFIHSPIIFGIIIFGYLIYMIISAIFGDYSSECLLYGLFYFGLMIIPYWIFWILSSNRKAFIMTTKTFEFWFKFSYCFWRGILLIIRDYYRVQSLDKYNNVNPSLLYSQRTIEGLIATPLFIAFVALFDAIRMKRKYKMILSALAAVFFFFYSFEAQFLESDDYVIYVKATNNLLSINSLLSETCRILGIFLLRQCILTFIRKDKCITINVSPFIKWFDTVSCGDVTMKPSTKTTEESASIAVNIAVNMNHEIITQMEGKLNHKSSASIDESQSEFGNGFQLKCVVLATETLNPSKKN